MTYLAQGPQWLFFKEPHTVMKKLLDFNLAGKELSAVCL